MPTLHRGTIPLTPAFIWSSVEFDARRHVPSIDGKMLFMLNVRVCREIERKNDKRTEATNGTLLSGDHGYLCRKKKCLKKYSRLILTGGHRRHFECDLKIKFPFGGPV